MTWPIRKNDTTDRGDQNDGFNSQFTSNLGISGRGDTAQRFRKSKGFSDRARSSALTRSRKRPVNAIPNAGRNSTSIMDTVQRAYANRKKVEEKYVFKVEFPYVKCSVAGNVDSNDNGSLPLQGYTLYLVKILTQKKKWKKGHRYSNFCKLHNDLQSNYKRFCSTDDTSNALQLPKLPPSGVLTKLFFVQDRQKSLNKYLSELLQTDLKCYSSLEILTQFLDDNTGTLKKMQTARHLRQIHQNVKDNQMFTELMYKKYLERKEEIKRLEGLLYGKAGTNDGAKTKRNDNKALFDTISKKYKERISSNDADSEALLRQALHNIETNNHTEKADLSSTWGRGVVISTIGKIPVRSTTCDAIESTTIIQESLKTRAICTGSFSTSTYLPNGDIDICTFVNADSHKDWYLKLQSALSTTSQKKSGGSNPNYIVRNVSFINARVKLVKCQVNNVKVDISANHSEAMLATALINTIDGFFGNHSLLKRSIILIKAWLTYEAPSLLRREENCQDADILGSEVQGMNTLGLIIFTLYVFNKSGVIIDGKLKTKITHPVQALALFFHFFKSFPWETHAVSIFGSVNLSTGVIEDNIVYPLITMQTIDSFRHMVGTVVPPTGSTMIYDPHLFSRSICSIVDPLNPANNLGSSLSLEKHRLLMKACSVGALRILSIFHLYRFAMSTRIDPSIMDNLPLPRSLKIEGKRNSGAHVSTLRHSNLNNNNSSSTTVDSSPKHPSTHLELCLATVDDMFVNSWIDFGRGDGWRPDVLDHPCQKYLSSDYMSPQVFLPRSPLFGIPFQATTTALQYFKVLVCNECIESALKELVTDIMTNELEGNSIRIGELGKFLQIKTGNKLLPQQLKEHFGGLKRFLSTHPGLVLLDDHRLNPSVILRK
eukprot:g2541.t1